MNRIICEISMFIFCAISSLAQLPSTWPRASNGVPMLQDGCYKIKSVSSYTDNSCTTRFPKEGEVSLYVADNASFMAVVGDGIIVQRCIDDVFPTTVCLQEGKDDPVLSYRSEDGGFVLWPPEYPSVSSSCDVDFNFAGTSYSIVVDLSSRTQYSEDGYLKRIGMDHPQGYPRPFYQGRYTIHEVTNGIASLVENGYKGYLYFDEKAKTIRFRYPGFNCDFHLETLLPFEDDYGFFSIYYWGRIGEENAKIQISYLPETDASVITVSRDTGEPKAFVYFDTDFQGATSAQIKTDF